MGATTWHYYTPHVPDPDVALQILRFQVFAQGAYLDPTNSPEQYIRRRFEEAGLDVNSPECHAAIEELLREERYMETGAEEDLRAVSRAKRGPLRRARELMILAGQAPRRKRPLPPSIEVLLDRAAECGTHSILDITHSAAHRMDGVAAPATSGELQRVFGTLQPTRKMVEAHWEQIAESLDRRQACYFIVYQYCQVHEYAFIGCSGD